jgi:hypothetical protein
MLLRTVRERSQVWQIEFDGVPCNDDSAIAIWISGCLHPRGAQASAMGIIRDLPHRAAHQFPYYAKRISLFFGLEVPVSWRIEIGALIS